MSTQTLLESHSSIELKGGMFTLTTVHLIDFNLEELTAQLDEKIKQAPNFFQYAPIILDLQRLRPQTASFDFQILIHTLRSKKLIPIGVRGASKALKEAAIQSGLAIFPEEKILANKKRSSAPEIKREYTSPSRSDAAAITSGGRLITQPVRSGQQIYAQGGDLVVIASVSHGAELLADGHIHVYGTMRGRALAGVMGNAEAMIFCRSLEAELVSIAGQYRLSEDLKESCWKESACIQLQEGRLHIRPI